MTLLQQVEKEKEIREKLLRVTQQIHQRVNDSTPLENLIRSIPPEDKFEARRMGLWLEDIGRRFWKGNIES